jgi:hypothetical protein
VKNAAEWKAFYAEERAALGEVGLRERLDLAPELELPTAGALFFPHTMLSMTGHLTAAVALAAVRSGAREVLALGVLHGGRRSDADVVERARKGDRVGREAVRRVHAADDAIAAEEFSLDGFFAMLDLAAARLGRPTPRVHARFPFFVGDDPGSLPGLDELARLAERMPVVATADPLHHGAGYGTPERLRRSERDESTHAWARGCIQTQLHMLGAGQWTSFATLADEVRCDARDVGPVLAHLLRGGDGGHTVTGEVLELHLVDYAEVLAAENPTWVAGPLMRVAR